MKNILISDKNEQNNEIHANFIDHEFSEVPLKQAHWGTYLNGHKPKIQQKWDRGVARAIASIIDEGVSAATTDKSDLRPKLFDQASGRTLLVDTGASRSVWPRADFPDDPIDPFKSLKAVNNSTIPTYGTRTIKVQPSKNYVFSHSFLLAPSRGVQNC